jgi:hypothetical protein
MYQLRLDKAGRSTSNKTITRKNKLMVKYDGIQEPQFIVLLLKIKLYYDPTF